ncbi:MAG: hypothetical protein HRU29_07580 [Rhizobiales bacterium]|nr:hypothetical protein [Hyphomicrobiales bacterium]NRB14247.1 hypothetical protein [Hyphomicrobiales bacterium]
MQTSRALAGTLTVYVFAASTAGSDAETPAQNINVTAFQQTPGSAPAQAPASAR